MTPTFTDPTWRFVEDWANKELKKCRERNDDANMSEQKTAALRGKISALKELLALPRVSASQAHTDDPD